MLACCLAGCAGDAGDTPAAPRVFRGQPFGRPMPVPGERALVYVVAAAPGGPRAAELQALDAHGKVLASDRESGPLGLPQLELPRGTRFAVLRAASASEPAGVLNVYANDAHDRDGDGVGRALEAALGTCDAPDQAHCARSPLAAYYARVPGGTRDSDRDGLSDADELWGVPGEPLLDLPRFGADPLHKDVFVEVDRRKGLAGPGLYESDLVQVAALFARGSAASLRNPDGLPGVRVHFDVGFEPEDPARRALLGDWGGSGRSSGNYKKARKRDFSKARAGYFRYAVLVRSGYGQSHGDAFVSNRDFQRTALFAHELAHTLGLKHHGHATWGAVNCKPNHESIINYAYQNALEVGFSTRASAALNPAGVIERGAVDAARAALLRAPPFELDVVDGAGGGVDWNRDGRISDEPVRAGLTWATYKSCDAAAFARTVLARRVQTASPALTSAAGVLHAFWITDDGELAHRTARTRPCDGSRPERCVRLGPVRAIDGHAGVRAVAVAGDGQGRAALAHVASDGALRVTELGLEPDAVRAGRPIEIAGARTAHAPAVAFMRVDPARYGVDRVLAVLFVAGDAQGTLVQASAPGPGGPFVLRALADAGLRPITTTLAPALAALGTGELCGAFPDRESLIRVYCYDPPRDVWHDLSAQAFYAGLGPRTFGPVGLAYHRYRTAAGAFVGGEPARGALYLSFTEPAPVKDDAPDNPQLLVSEWLDAREPAASSLQFRWRGNAVNQWTHLAAGTALVLHEDAALPALAGLMLRRAGDEQRLELLPFADGSFDLPLHGGDDFAVMERGICAQLRGAAACGGPDTGSY